LFFVSIIPKCDLAAVLHLTNSRYLRIIFPQDLCNCIPQAAGLESRYAKTVGINVDHRRTNKSEATFQLNVNRLKDYKSRLVVLSKKTTKIDTPQLTTELMPEPKKESAVSYIKLTEVIYSDS
jgi:hypothetical protein